MGHPPVFAEIEIITNAQLYGCTFLGMDQENSLPHNLHWTKPTPANPIPPLSLVSNSRLDDDLAGNWDIEGRTTADFSTALRSGRNDKARLRTIQTGTT